VSKAINKSDVEVESFYFGAIIKSDENNPNRDIHLANSLLKKFDDTLSEMELYDYNQTFKKLNITKKDKLALREKINTAAFLKAKKLNTIEGYNAFVKDYYSISPEQLNEVKREIEYIYLSIADSIGTLQSYQEFLSRYPFSESNDSIRKEIEKLEYSEILSEPTLDWFDPLLFGQFRGLLI
jgi:hypothetical protein